MISFFIFEVAMISTVSTRFVYHPKKEPNILLSINFSQNKLKQIALGFFSVLFIFAGCSFLFYSFSAAIIEPVFFAIPCFLAAGYTVWSIFVTYEYNVPTKLEAFRRAAKERPLQETIKQHGFEKMFQYEIPLRDDFPKVFRETLKKMSLNEGLDFCEQISQAHKKAGSPEGYVFSSSSVLREKWKAQKNKNPICFLLTTYDLKKLLEFGIVTPGMSPEYDRLIAAKAVYDQFCENFYQKIQTIEIQFHKNCIPALTKLSQSLKKEEKNHLYNKDHLLAIQDLLQNIRKVMDEKNSSFSPLKEKFLEKLLIEKQIYSPEIIKVLQICKNEIYAFSKNRLKSLQRAENEKIEKIEKINSDYRIEETPVIKTKTTK